jgi:hypothetical protein
MTISGRPCRRTASSKVDLVDAVADHVARLVVEEDQREGRSTIDVTVDEVEVPHVVGPHCLEPLVMLPTLYLRRSVAGLLHHAAHGVD